MHYQVYSICIYNTDTDTVSYSRSRTVQADALVVGIIPKYNIINYISHDEPDPPSTVQGTDYLIPLISMLK